jgi:hypothetical protein
MKNEMPQVVAPNVPAGSDIEQAIRAQITLLGHEGFGVTELRLFDPFAQVAYADGLDAVIGLCRQMDGKTAGIYAGVQPRPVHLFDLAPNRWVPARGGTGGNCARDDDIEYITAAFFDIDVTSPARQEGHPASDEELAATLRVAQELTGQDGLAGHSTVCCSGNGHYVLAPIVPLPVDGQEVARKFTTLCRQLADGAADQLTGVRIDAVYNLSRVMRVMGTVNRKGKPLPDRPHRRACFVTGPAPARSLMLHWLILNADVAGATTAVQDLPIGLRCNLSKIERCEFIQWCRRRPQEVSEPAWFALISNLAYLQGGIDLIHEISALDTRRYDCVNTERVIERVLREGYKPVRCAAITGPDMVRPGRGVFRCSQAARCPVRTPMYLAASRTVYTR